MTALSSLRPADGSLEGIYASVRMLVVHSCLCVCLDAGSVFMPLLVCLECIHASVGVLGVYSCLCLDAGSVFMPLLVCWECI